MSSHFAESWHRLGTAGLSFSTGAVSRSQKLLDQIKSLSATEIGFNLESHYNNQSEHQEAITNTEEELEKILSDELVASC